MPNENNEKNPRFATKDMDLDETIRIKLTSPSAIASGNSKYGRWELWPIEVTNTKVFDGETKKEIENYTGKAVMFPPPKLRDKFKEVTHSSNENVVVDITKVAKNNSRGSLYTDFDIKVIETGTKQVVSNAVNPFMAAQKNDKSKKIELNSVEQKLVQDAKEVLKQSEITMEQFVEGAISSYNVKKERAEEIWKSFF